MEPSFFEGPEKKFELVVAGNHRDLRSYGDATWKRIVAAAHASVLSKRSTDTFDAYLLSESSLFVFPDHLTMITCGRTRLADALLETLALLPSEDIALVIYERKNEHFPMAQHTSFHEDGQRLLSVIDGRAVRFGAADRHNVHLFHSRKPYVPHPNDTTIEVLMHGIPDRVAAMFAHLPSTSEPTTADRLGLAQHFPEFEIDEHVFRPSGYSLNAVRGSTYYTVHVTPEMPSSYVSFETNCDFRSGANALVGDIVATFQPDSFDVLSFAPRDHVLTVAPPGYLAVNSVRDSLCGYSVDFLEFAKPVSESRRASVVTL